MRGRAHGAGWEVSPCPGQPSSWWVSELTGPGLCARSREGLSSRSISQGMLSGPAPCRQCPAAAWALSPWHRQVTGAVGRVVAMEVPVLGQPGGRIRAQGSPGCSLGVLPWQFGVGSLGLGCSHEPWQRALCWRSTGLATLVASRSDGDKGAALLPPEVFSLGRVVLSPAHPGTASSSLAAARSVGTSQPDSSVPVGFLLTLLQGIYHLAPSALCSSPAVRWARGLMAEHGCSSSREEGAEPGTGGFGRALGQRGAVLHHHLMLFWTPMSPQGGQPRAHPALGPPGCPWCERGLAGLGQWGGAQCWWRGASGVVLKLHLRGGQVPSPAAVSPLSLSALGNPGELGVRSTLVPGSTQRPPPDGCRWPQWDSRATSAGDSGVPSPVPLNGSCPHLALHGDSTALSPAQAELGHWDTLQGSVPAWWQGWGALQDRVLETATCPPCHPVLAARGGWEPRTALCPPQASPENL